jgi:hypothetical protein
VDDAVQPEPATTGRSDGPVAHAPAPAPGGDAAGRPALTAGPGAGGTAAVGTRSTFTARPRYAEVGAEGHPGRDLEFVTSGGVATRRASASAAIDGSDPRGARDAVAGGQTHPAFTADEVVERLRAGAGGGDGVRAATRTAPSSPLPSAPDEDLAAPATPRVLRAEERVPLGVAEANIRDVDGEEVFVLWRPDGLAATPRPDGVPRGAR